MFNLRCVINLNYNLKKNLLILYERIPKQKMKK